MRKFSFGAESVGLFAPGEIPGFNPDLCRVPFQVVARVLKLGSEDKDTTALTQLHSIFEHPFHLRRNPSGRITEHHGTNRFHRVKQCQL